MEIEDLVSCSVLRLSWRIFRFEDFSRMLPRAAGITVAGRRPPLLQAAGHQLPTPAPDKEISWFTMESNLPHDTENQRHDLKIGDGRRRSAARPVSRLHKSVAEKIHQHRNVLKSANEDLVRLYAHFRQNTPPPHGSNVVFLRGTKSNLCFWPSVSNTSKSLTLAANRCSRAFSACSKALRISRDVTLQLQPGRIPRSRDRQSLAPTSLPPQLLVLLFTFCATLFSATAQCDKFADTHSSQRTDVGIVQQ